MRWDYWRLLTIVSIAGFVGLLFDQMMTFMFVVSFLYALWLQQSWYSLWSWLQKPKKNPPPSAEGVIDDVCREIERVRQQNRSRKKRLAGYLKRFQLATAALPDAIVILGQYRQIDWANDAAKTLLGIRSPQDSDVRIDNLIRDPQFQRLLIDPVDSERTLLIASPINTDKQLEVKIVNFMKEGRMLIARDMTQTIKLQTMRRDFVANVSHELRTPLTVLRGYLETIGEQSPAEQWQQALPVMRQQAERMGAMLQDLLVLSRLETGEKQLQHDTTDIARLLTEVIDSAKQLADYQNHDIQMQLKSDRWLLADAGELRSAVSNLVFNAVKYTPATCKITVTWSVDDKTACIGVIDEGEGIAEHHIDRLTERFYRVDGSRSQESGGTGLGLAIVKHVLQRHDAELRISSTLGQGSQFYCCFSRSRVVEKPS